MSTISKLIWLSLSAGAAAQHGYFAFCNTADSKDCGIGVSTGNNGCLQESGRQSIKCTEPDSTLNFPVLVAYSDDNCQTEIGCNTVGTSGHEQDWSFVNDQQFKFAHGALSFKFLDSCPNGCTGLCSNSKRSRIEAPEYVKEKRQGGSDYWFCDDDQCSVNCGYHIEPNSAGCANGESGRKSIYYTGKNYASVQLGAYDNGDCSGAPPATTFSIVKGCNVLPSQHESWQSLGTTQD